MQLMNIEPERLVYMYRQMLTIRRFEEAVWDVYTRALMPGIAHLSIGQEGVAVGACAALQPDDYIMSNHRGHGHCIAKGSDVNRMMAEILGKDTGYCRGKGGTMHIADAEHRNLGATGIVGGGIGLAVGVGLTIQIQGSRLVSLCFFGDGAANQGIFHESMNLAAIWRLPVIFLCENNQYGEYTSAEKVTAGQRVADRARAFEIPAVTIDGMDVLAVCEAVGEAAARARTGGGPTMIEALTYRYGGHHVGDPGKYRESDEINQWKQRDPIANFERRLADSGLLSETDINAIGREVEETVQAAVEFAKASPLPALDQVYEHVFA
jgi:pyruvate dehydrogenase E1 component alpha subunit